MLLALAIYALLTCVAGVGQWYENRYHNEPQYYAPVWWIMLSWPFWIAYTLIVVPWLGVVDRFRGSR